MFTKPKNRSIEKVNQKLNVKLAFIYFLLVLFFTLLIVML